MPEYLKSTTRWLLRKWRLFSVIALTLIGIQHLREMNPATLNISAYTKQPDSQRTNLLLGADSPPPATKRLPKILYYNRHSACTNNMAYITSRLGLNFTLLRPGFLGDLGMRQNRANDIINDGFVSAICTGFDVIIISDTLPDARPILQSLLRKHPSERCQSNIVIELTNRFDWGVADFDEYHELIWELSHVVKPKNLYWVANNAFEAKVMADDCNASPEFRILRPSGYSDVEARKVTKQQEQTALMRELDKSEVLGIMTLMQIPFTRAVGHYGGPKTLKRYKAYIEFPYQVSTMKLYENLAEGVLMLVPSAEFFKELVEKRIHAFGPWEMLRRMGPNWHTYMDYYTPTLSPYIKYFNSFAELKQILTSPDPIDPTHIRDAAAARYKQIVGETLNGWAELFGEMGFSVLVDGKNVGTGNRVTKVEKFRVSARYAQPNNVQEWKQVYEKIKSWKNSERNEQNRIWDENEKRLEGVEKQVKEMIKKGESIVDLLEREKVEKVEVDQYRALDYFNGEVGKGKEEVFGGALVEGGDGFDASTIITSLLSAYQEAHNFEWKGSDFGQFGLYARFLRIFHTAWKDKVITGSDAKVLEDAVSTLTNKLYPWIVPTGEVSQDASPTVQILDNVQSKFNGRGIVLTFPTSGYPRGIHLILTIRKILKCDLPIEIFYIGEGDLSAEKRKKLETLPNVTVKDITKTLPLVKEVHGFNIKPFVILASRFQEVIFLDDDVTLLQNPVTLLKNSKLYNKYGVLFFLDRSFSAGDSTWVRGFLKIPSVVAGKGRYFKNISRDEQESSMVVLDKGRDGVFYALLAACHMNLRESRDEALHKHTHGDKESFWIAHEMVRAPYDFVPGIGGAAGMFRTRNNISETDVVCGPQSHVDEQGRLVHFNGPVLKSKDRVEEGYLDFHHFVAPVLINPGNVDIGYSPWCVHARKPQEEVFEMSVGEKDVIAQIIAMHKRLVEAGFEIVE